MFPNLFPTLLYNNRIFCDLFLSSQLHKKVSISKANIFYLCLRVIKKIQRRIDYRDVQILLKKKKKLNNILFRYIVDENNSIVFIKRKEKLLPSKSLLVKKIWTSNSSSCFYYYFTSFVPDKDYNYQ